MQQQFGPTSSSVDDLAQTLHSPSVSQGQPGLPGPVSGQAAALHHQPAPTEAKRSKRNNIIKNISSAFSSSRNSDNSHHQHNHSYDNTSSLARRPSKRVSNPFPPTIRTGASQVSLEQLVQHPDWTAPQSQNTQQSPLQGVGETDESCVHDGPNQGRRAQKLQKSQPQDPRPRPHQNTIRQVPTDIDTSPYSHEDLVYQRQQAQAQHQQAHLQLQGHTQVEQQQQQQLYGQGHYHPGNPPQSYVGHLGASSQPPNPETVSQLSYESPVTDNEQRAAQPQSAQTQASPAVSYPHQDVSTTQPSPQSVSPAPSASQPANMPLPPGGPGASRRSAENEKALRGSSNVDPPPGPPPGYRHSQAPLNSMNPVPATPAGGNHNQNYRASNVPERAGFDGSAEAGGRNSPQPSTGDREAEPDKQFKDLLTKYKNVKRLYFDGKTQIEQLSTQVEQLQNAVANQRISQSRTALDDSEYTTRFNRLNGAINNLSFNIRKDWRTLPAWIDRYVSTEALKTGKQEMTAVGRAIIIRWVVDEIFNRCFHPGLDMDLSRQLKEIEQNIRRFSYTMSSQEEYDALTSKVVSWRMATLEGLQRSLQSPESAMHRADFTTMAASNLTAHLYQHLTDPPPAGVDGSVAMIVELAVGIAANLPLESRDVAVVYPLPGDLIRSEIMEPEKAGLPPLPEPDEAEDSGKDGDKTSQREKAKSGMLHMLNGAPLSSSRKGSVVSNTDATDSTAPPPRDASRVRFAGFIAVEVRGRQILVKAPVWSLG
ncbi:uncharacterized protein BCR38DRAFT_344903 [Pseudomassariella vexata]|uniref:S-adenosylmethionine-dependent methyltransferase-like protein n=1 Tax=Pseudomassariella vexata TaxID=1141098 RepID=A0A1Y2DY34_9PEZI|nr:uncharacterized protein BCR38DRAFT_344903 [Pseudomassariella vexata]ORY63545.1 hypothetical protein BCR38DRAFT_344903 [Pseudomassariella vexata]